MRGTIERYADLPWYARAEINFRIAIVRSLALVVWVDPPLAAAHQRAVAAIIDWRAGGTLLHKMLADIDRVRRVAARQHD